MEAHPYAYAPSKLRKVVWDGDILVATVEILKSGNHLTEWTQFTILVIYLLPITLAIVAPIMQLEMRHTFMLKHPMYNHIRSKFPTILLKYSIKGT